MSLLRQLIGFGGMLESLPRIFVPSLTIFLLVVRRGDSVCVCGDIMELRCSLM
jgi:hypothetical protein